MKDFMFSFMVCFWVMQIFIDRDLNYRTKEQNDHIEKCGKVIKALQYQVDILSGKIIETNFTGSKTDDRTQ